MGRSGAILLALGLSGCIEPDPSFGGGTATGSTSSGTTGPTTTSSTAGTSSATTSTTDTTSSSSTTSESTSSGSGTTGITTATDTSTSSTTGTTTDTGTTGPLPSCDDQYGAIPGYVLCEETDSTCKFNANTMGMFSCNQVCQQGGGMCLEGLDNNGPCEEVGNDGCDFDMHNTELCVCTKG